MIYFQKLQRNTVILIGSCLFLLFCLTALLLNRQKSVHSKVEPQQQVVEDVQNPTVILQQVLTKTRARAVFVYDMSTGEVVAEKNSAEKRSLASLTKIVTAALIYESRQGTSSKHRVLPQIQHMLTTSSNEEAEALAYSFGNTVEEQVGQMNLYGKKYNLSFRNVSGLDIILDDGVSRQPSSSGSAASIAELSADVYNKYPELFDTTTRDDYDNTNTATNKFGFMLGGKTGFTDLAGGNLLVIVQKGLSHPYLVVVLGSTEKGRFVDVEHIVSALLQLQL